MCYSVFARSKNPIAPKSLCAFYGVAKIDKIFELQKVDVKLFDQSRCLVPSQGLVVFAQFHMTVAREIHAEPAECVY